MLHFFQSSHFQQQPQAPVNIQALQPQKPNNRRSGVWNASAVEPTPIPVPTTPAPQNDAKLMENLTKPGRRGTINLGAEVLALPSFMRNQMQQQEKSASSQPEPTPTTSGIQLGRDRKASMVPVEQPKEPAKPTSPRASPVKPAIPAPEPEEEYDDDEEVRNL